VPVTFLAAEDAVDAKPRCKPDFLEVPELVVEIDVVDLLAAALVLVDLTMVVELDALEATVLVLSLRLRSRVAGREGGARRILPGTPVVADVIDFVGPCLARIDGATFSCEVVF
jgi:hypothetical protein